MRFASVFSRFCPAVLLGAAALLPWALHAQTPGSLDTAFISPVLGSTVFAVTTEYVPTSQGLFEYIPQGGDQDGLYITYFEGLPVMNYAFPDFGGEGRIVYTLVPEAFLDPGATTYKILAGGAFGKTEINGNFVESGNLARFDVVTGTLDATFTPGVGADDYVTSILPLSDGTTMVGGLFIRYQTESFPRLVRIGRVGEIDTNFAPVAFTDAVLALAQEYDPATGAPDGKIIVGGTFSTIGNSNYTKLARVDLAGNVDPNFRPTIDTRVLAIATQPDGKIVIGGEFAVINGQSVGHIARLNHDGSLDTSFNASISVLPQGTTDPVAVYVLKLLPDGRIYVGGQFGAIDGVTRQYLGVINSDGSLDASFEPGTVITNSVQTLAVQLDGRVLVGETVSKKPVDSDSFPPSLIRLYGAAATVKAAAPRPQAVVGTTEQRRTGAFTLKRGSGDLTSSLTVAFQLSGAALAQNDKSFHLVNADPVGGNVYTATFAPNLTKYKVKVVPRRFALPQSPEAITLTLLPAQSFTSSYEPGVSTTATVSVVNAP